MFSCLSNYFYSKESLIKMCKKAVILCIVLTDDERNDEEVETPNAKVSLKMNDSIYKTLKTDENGYFELIEIPIGKYEIVLES